MTKNRYTSRTDLDTEANIKPLKVIREKHTDNIVNKGLNQESTPLPNDSFKIVSGKHDRHTRSSNMKDIHIPTTRTEHCKGNIRVRGPKYYSKLPLDIRESKITKIFKDGLTKYSFPQ